MFLWSTDVLSDVLGPDGLLASKRNHAKLMREGFRHVLLWHWKQHMAFHFQSAAFARYGAVFKPRDPDYVAHRTKSGKYRRGPKPKPPNVKSGDLKRKILGTEPKITATQSRAQMTMRPDFAKSGRFRFGAPTTFKQAAARRRAIERIAELEVISPEEDRAMRAEFKAEYLRRLAADGGKLRRVRKR